MKSTVVQGSPLGGERFGRLIVDRGRAGLLKGGDLGDDPVDLIGGVEDFEGRLGLIAGPGGEGDDAETGLLERLGVGEVGRWFEAGDVAVVQAAEVLPQGEARQLAAREAKDDRLRPGWIDEHGQRGFGRAGTDQVGEVGLLGESDLGRAVGGELGNPLGGAGVAGGHLGDRGVEGRARAEVGGPRFQW